MFKQLWNAVKPPPPVPRRPGANYPQKTPSVFRRFWNSIKPPPAVQSQGRVVSAKEKKNRRRVLVPAVTVILIGAAIGGAYYYITSAPERANKALQDGMALMAKSDFKGAVARFSRAAEIRPQLAAAYLDRGLAHRAMNQLDAATEDFKQAIDADPRLAAAHTGLGVIYREHGDLQSAIEEFTRAINIESNTDSFFQRGQLYEAMGEHEKAIADYDASIHEQPDAPFVYRARALSKDNLGDHDGADEDRHQADSLLIP